MSDPASIEEPNWLRAGDFTAADDPLLLFAGWFDEATRQEPSDPNAMALATCDAEGLPNVRMVLLKGLDEGGFVFYTNLDSQKGRELAAQPQGALSFHWKSLRRQVRVRGPVDPVPDEAADGYFATRPRGAQIGAWASKQSWPLDSRATFERAIDSYVAKFAAGAVPRPPRWSGFRVVPLVMEFWQDRPFRLHDRVEFRRQAPDLPWTRTRLYP